jgi:hypothetical protein
VGKSSKCQPKRGEGAKHENFEEALMISVRQSNAKNGTATDEVIEERTKGICKYVILTF